MEGPRLESRQGVVIGALPSRLAYPHMLYGTWSRQCGADPSVSGT